MADPGDASGRGAGDLLVLGGAGGLGGAIVREAAARPGRPRRIWITYNRDQAAAEQLCTRVEGCAALACDLREAASLSSVVEALRTAGASLDAVVHAAVAPVAGALLDVAPGDLRAGLDVSALSLVDAVGALGPLVADAGSVVFLTSIGSDRVVPRYGVIGIAKATAEAAVRYLAAELGHRGITVNAVSAGPVLTKALQAVFEPEQAARMVDAVGRRSPLQPPARDTDIARFVVGLCGPDGRAVTGQVVAVDGGAFLWA